MNLYPKPIQILYVYAVIIVTLFIMGFLWIVMNSVVTSLRAGINTAMSPYNVANSSYQSYALADTFMYNIWFYMLCFVVIIILYWLYIYGQRRSVGYA